MAGETILSTVVIFVTLYFFLRFAFSAQAWGRVEKKYCLACYNIGEQKSIMPGSVLIELALWLCFLLPGLIYSVWRLTAKHKACGSCGSKELVPVDSPRAKAAMKSLPLVPDEKK